MKKSILILFLVGIFAYTTANAAIRHLTDTEGGSEGSEQSELNEFRVDSQMKCRSEGYNKKVCAKGLTPAKPCPYDGSIFGECCSPAYAFTEEACIAKGMEASKRTCDGLHICVDVAPAEAQK